MAQFEIAVELTLLEEGGFAYNKITGEVVNRGITLALLRDLGTLKTEGPPTPADIEFVQSLSLDETKEIYQTVFWTPCRLDEITYQTVANKVFDLQVNTDRGVRFLQAAINQISDIILEVDGILGLKTLEAANMCSWPPEAVVLLGRRANGEVPGSGIRGFAEQYYISIPDPGGACPGWLARLDK